MRIIAGKFGKRKLKAVDGLKTRPTADKIKEAVFSTIGNDIYDARFLDVFAGTGSISLEAISRGAQFAVLLEKDKDAQKVIAENIALCKANDSCKLYKGDSLELLHQLSAKNESFDLIYIDPPYQGELYKKTIEILEKEKMLTKNGTIIVESEKNTSILPANSLFCIYKEKFYGISKITYLRWLE